MHKRILAGLLVVVGMGCTRVIAAGEATRSNPGINALKADDIPFDHGDLFIYVSTGYEIPQNSGTTVYWDHAYTGTGSNEVIGYQIVVTPHFAKGAVRDAVVNGFVDVGAKPYRYDRMHGLDFFLKRRHILDVVFLQEVEHFRRSLQMGYRLIVLHVRILSF